MRVRGHAWRDTSHTETKPSTILPTHQFACARRCRAAGWKPSLTIKHLLLGIQTMLHDPSNAGPVQEKPYHAFKNDKTHYEETVKEQVRLLA
tara:strand:- start:34 stop:309 length:276 start_codon:yes stop_codon:yes gene_type:complete